MTENKSIKFTERGYSFLDKMAANRVKADSDSKTLFYWELLEIIAKYFKLNNDKYLELIKMEWNKGA